MPLPRIKFNLKLTTALWVVLAVVVLAEVFTLYQYLFTSFAGGESQSAADPAQETARIDRPALAKFQEWLSARENYVLPPPSPGNPFVEYK